MVENTTEILNLNTNLLPAPDPILSPNSSSSLVWNSSSQTFSDVPRDEWVQRYNSWVHSDTHLNLGEFIISQRLQSSSNIVTQNDLHQGLTRLIVPHMDPSPLRQTPIYLERPRVEEQGIEFILSMQNIINQTYVRIRDDAVRIQTNSESGLIEFVPGNVANFGNQLLEALRNPRVPLVNIQLDHSHEWHQLIQNVPHLFRGLPQRFLEIIYLLGEEFCGTVLNLLNTYSEVNPIRLHSIVAQFLVPFFAFFLGNEVHALSFNDFLNLVKTGILHVHFIFSCVTVATTVSVNFTEIIERHTERQNLSISSINQIPIRLERRQYENLNK